MTHPYHHHGYESDPHPHLNPSSTSCIEIGTNCFCIQLPHTTRVCNTSGDSTLVTISAREKLLKAQMAITMMTTKTTAITTAWGGVVILCSSAMGWSRREMLGKESTEGRCRKVGDVEEKGAMMIGTLTADDNDNGHASLGIGRGVKGVLNVPRIMALWWFACPPT